MKKLFRDFMKHQTPPNSPKLFEYSPLKAGEIRLLKLQSTDGGASSVICGELITRDLSKSNSKTEYDYNHEYEALSYVWGDESASCQIRLDDCHFHIRPNLAVALRSLSRQSPMERLLWIDAICINQADNAEKNLQVKQMGLIFQQAKGVLIWINSPGVTVRMDVDVQTRHAFRDFARHHSAGRDPKRLADILDSPRPSVLYDYAQEGGHWPALVRFFDQDWWQRVWVRQEIAMSQEATVLCGYQSVNWERVAALSHWLNLFMSDLDDKTRKFGARHRSGAYSGEDLQDFRQTLQRGGDLDFQTMIIHARNCEATDPRDRVFAVLGMVKDDGDISPDYNLTPAEVAKQAFQRLATLNDGLDALIFSQNPSRREGIPSWAPDIYSKFSAQPSRMSGRSSSLYSASGSSRQAEYSFSADGITLSVSVGIFDSIGKISPTFPAGMSPKKLDDSMRTLRKETFSWLAKMRTDQKYEHLMRTLTRDRDIGGRRLMSNVYGLDWGKFFRLEHSGVGAVTEFQYLSRAIRQLQAPVDDDAECRAWLRLYSESIGDRRVALTDGGRLGLVPAATGSLDVVCIMDGLDVPLILRRTYSGSYVLIGEAYVHGAMDGEIRAEAQMIDLE